MRIISGKYKGFTIVDPNNKNNTRVSKERLREGVFSALQNETKGRMVLDLFAGSGAFGFEAYSRGAKSAYLIDSDFHAVKCINKTLQNLKASNDDLKVFYGSYPEILPTLNTVFDLVFLDPPYGVYSIDNIISDLIINHLINSETILVIEEKNHYESAIHSFSSYRKYKYGINHVTIVQGVKL